MELLNRNDLNREIKKMIRTEKDYVLLLSPFIKLSEGIISVLNSSKAQICLIVKKDKDNVDYINYIKKNLHKIKLFEVEFLHAKIYMSSSKIIITSMNIYEYSQKNNFEVGLIFDNNKDDKICHDLYLELENLFEDNGIKKFWLDKLYYTKLCPKCKHKIPDNIDSTNCFICNSKGGSKQNANDRKT